MIQVNIFEGTTNSEELASLVFTHSSLKFPPKNISYFNKNIQYTLVYRKMMAETEATIPKVLFLGHLFAVTAVLISFSDARRITLKLGRSLRMYEVLVTRNIKTRNVATWLVAPN